jgi:membrane-associated protein
MPLLRSPAHLSAGLGPEWVSPERIAAAGLVVLLLVVFAETGLLAGFLLPGDALLFTVGLLINQGTFDVALWLVLLLVPLAAVLGDQTGYAIGRRAGPRVLDRPDSRWLKRSHVERAAGYFQRHGARTVVLARFVPVVRTLAPVVAGVSRMNHRTFLLFNVLGAVLWGAGVPLVGYAVGEVDPIARNVGVLGLAVVLISVVLLSLEVWRARRAHLAGVGSGAPED